jgi:glycosyltransferase involved in cell wall biosynthesis
MPGVLILIKGLGRGGAETLLAAAAPHLDGVRFRYELAYLLPWKDALVGEIGATGLPVHCLDGDRGVSWVGRLRELVHGRGIGLVHGHSPVAAAVARAALRQERHVYTEHNVWARYHPATRWANSLTFPRNDHVFTVSDEVRASVAYPPVLRFRRMPPVETLYHGLAPGWANGVTSDGVREELGIPESSPVVGTVGNFTPKKAHGTLVEAAVLVRAKVPEARVVMVGHGPLEGELRRRARQLGLEEAVIFTGYREDAARVTSAFDVFALPSAFEGLSVALLEAMALGRPVVATRVGGTPEVVRDGTEGFLVPPGDQGALAEGIARLLRDRDLSDRMGKAARQRADAFDIRQAIRRMEEVYAELLH